MDVITVHIIVCLFENDNESRPGSEIDIIGFFLQQ